MNEMFSLPEASSPVFAELTTGLVSAYVSNNRVSAADLPALIAATHAALSGLARAGAPSFPAAEKATPAQIRKSITHDALISFLDGMPYKTLKRHLNGHGLTFEAYCERYGLPRDYPTTAASYSARRSELAKSLGLGRARRQHSETEPTPEPAPAAEPPKKRGRAKKAVETAAE